MISTHPASLTYLDPTPFTLWTHPSLRILCRNVVSVSAPVSTVSRPVCRHLFPLPSTGVHPLICFSLLAGLPQSCHRHSLKENLEQRATRQVILTQITLPPPTQRLSDGVFWFFFPQSSYDHMLTLPKLGLYQSAAAVSTCELFRP